MKIICPSCKNEVERLTGEVNRALKRGLRIFCSRKCSGVGRRKNRPVDEIKKLKADYDTEYRKKNRERLKCKKQEYFKRTYDPVKAAAERKLKMHRHVQYCRQPAYKEKKKNYDRRHRAEITYGAFHESFLLLQDIEAEISSRMDRYEIYLTKGTLNKHQQRRKDYDRLNRN